MTTSPWTCTSPGEQRHASSPGKPRQVCDRCGGRFGMVTHRWWGKKFCKKVCKETHLREVAISRDLVLRWLSPVHA